MLRVRSTSFQDVVYTLQNTGPCDRLARIQVLQAFVCSNEDPGKSANYKSAKQDRIVMLRDVLCASKASDDLELVLLLLQVFKILSRKESNRMSAGIEEVKVVLQYLEHAANPRIASEAANVLLNLCYERKNVEILIECGGVQLLLDALSSDDLEVQANAAGAIQSLCFQDIGRKHMRGTSAIARFISLLDSRHIKVRLRSVGALHNLSSDPKSILVIRHNGGIPKLVEMLQSPHLSIKGSAAGALQNLSREVASRILIQKLDAVSPLTQLLMVRDMQAQVCAAGALLNLLGPDLVARGEGQREGLGKMISLILSLSIVSQGLEEAYAPLA